MQIPQRVRDYAWPIASLLVLLAVVAYGTTLGILGREMPAQPQRIEVDSPSEAYEALQEAGVHGATFVLFDATSGVVNRIYPRAPVPGVKDTVDHVGQSNVLSELLDAGTARAAYVAMPDAEYAKIAPRLGDTWDAIPSGAGYRRRLYGAPVTLVPSSRLPRIDEPVVVYVITNKAGQYDPAVLQKWQDPAVARVVLLQEIR